MKKETNNNKGFSLVELIVVIAIMAVLIGVLAPAFTKYVERSRKSTDVQNVASVITAVQTYNLDAAIVNNATTMPAVANGNTLTLTKTADPACNPTDAGLKKALENAGLDKMRLKSDKWISGGSVVITFAVDDNGVVTATATPQDIIDGNVTVEVSGGAGGDGTS